MIHKFSRYLLTLVALLTMTTGAWADEPKVYNTTVDRDKLNVGDILIEGATVTAGDSPMYKLASGTYKYGGTVKGSETADYFTSLTIGQNGIADGKYTPYDNAAQKDGNAWEVTGNDMMALSLKGITYVTAPEVEVEISTDQQSAEFEMPSYDATLEYDIVRNLASNVNAEIVERIRIQKNTSGMFVAVDESQLVPTVEDVANAQNPVTLQADKDYTVTFQKKDGDTWVDVTVLSVGTFRLAITGKDDSNYGGTCYTNEFQLFQGYEVEIAAGEYITYYKDEPLYVENENAKLYTITAVDETTATATELTVVPALTPILVKNTAETTQTILLIPTTDKTPDAVEAYTGFIGTLEATTIAASDATADRYAFNGKQFVWVKTALAVAANKAWLEIPAASNARVINLVFGDATKITTTNITNLTNGDWYDLNGRKLNAIPTKKGVYIMNGRKVVVK